MRRALWRAYLLAVIVAGLAVAAALPRQDLVSEMRGLWPLVLLTVAAELRPLRGYRADDSLYTTATGFGFALLLLAGTPVAVAVAAGSSVIADVVGRRAPIKAAFNAAQYALSFAAAGVAGHWIADSGAPLLRNDDTGAVRLVVAVVASGTVAVFTNMLLVDAARALTLDVSIVQLVRDEFSIQVLPVVVPIALGPMAAALIDRTLWFTPVIALLMGAVHMATRETFEREFRALHDDHTGIQGRVLFERRLADALSDSESSHVGVLRIALARLPDVQAELGHEVADQLTKEVAARLVARHGLERVGRLSGDEFAVLIVKPGEAEVAMEAHAAVDTLGMIDVAPQFGVDPVVRSGLVVYPRDGPAAEALMNRAGMALRSARLLEAPLTRYDPVKHGGAKRRLTLLADLPRALETRDLVLHYQPQVLIESGVVIGAEALIRWQRPDGFIPPVDFVPAAEQTTLIDALTDYVLDEAIAWAAEDPQGRRMRVSVNLSVRNLADRRLPERIAEKLQSHGLPPTQLGVELTESAVMLDDVVAAGVVRDLGEMGLHLSIDDFGTGNASLVYLQQLPIQTVKLDKSFVARLPHDRASFAIVRAVVDLSRSLGLHTVAEGVETSAALDALAKLGCWAAQGYLISRPLPAETFAGWVEERERGPGE